MGALGVRLENCHFPLPILTDPQWQTYNVYVRFACSITCAAFSGTDPSGPSATADHPGAKPAAPSVYIFAIKTFSGKTEVFPVTDDDVIMNAIPRSSVERLSLYLICISRSYADLAGFFFLAGIFFRDAFVVFGMFDPQLASGHCRLRIAQIITTC